MLFHCDVAYRLWSVVLVAFGIHWVLPKMVAKLVWKTLFGYMESCAAMFDVAFVK